MNWSNLKDNKCPECNKDLVGTPSLVRCECGFKIRKSKILDLTKGKESNAYLAVKKKYTKIKAFNKKKKEHLIAIKKVADQERLSNLNRMLFRKEITQTEYDIKVSTIKELVLTK